VEQSDQDREEVVEVPFDRIKPETPDKRNRYQGMGGSGRRLLYPEQKIEQVRQQLKDRRAKIVFGLTSYTCNFVLAK
jgi:hypothetical protein